MGVYPQLELWVEPWAASDADDALSHSEAARVQTEEEVTVPSSIGKCPAAVTAGVCRTQLKGMSG